MTVAVALAFIACGRSDQVAPPTGTRTVEQELAADPGRALDLLFVIINSASTIEEQETLGRAFPTLLAELAALPGGAPDLHVGVVSSDLGAGSFVLNDVCRPGGDRGVFQTLAGCGLEPGSRFAIWADGGRQTNFGGDLARVFACLVRIGSAGCAFEHHLQAARLALDEAATPENRGFLRPDAHLGIVLLSDDDDCSADPSNHLFDNFQPMEWSGTFCARAGHMCGGAPVPASGPIHAPLAQCQPSDHGGLIPVPQLVSAIRGVKRRPDQVTVAGILPLPPDEASAFYEIRAYGNRTDLVPGCSSVQGDAGVGLRLKAFVDAFGGVRDTICQAEYTATARALGQRLVERMSITCLEAPLADLDQTTPGLQPGCQVLQRTPRTGGSDETPLPACTPQSARPCWSLVADSRCAGSGLRVIVDRAGATAAAGTTQLFRCQTCVDANDPRCQR